jgi:hypothetical protein
LRQLKGIAALLVLVVGWGSWRAQAIEAELEQAPVARIGLLQQDVSMEERIISPQDAILDWMQQTQEVSSQEPDLVIWAEGAIPFDASVGGDEPERIAAFCGLSFREYFEFMAGQGGAGILVDSLGFRDAQGNYHQWEEIEPQGESVTIDMEWSSTPVTTHLFLKANGAPVGNRGICMSPALWAEKSVLDSMPLSEEDFAERWDKKIDQVLAEHRGGGTSESVTQCGFDMLIGAGSRADDRVFNTAFGISRTERICGQCTGEACVDSPVESDALTSFIQAQADILRCTGRFGSESEKVASCLAEKGMALGRLQDGYDKMIPLPFGEYVPLSDLFPSLRGSIQGVGDFKAGEEVKIFTGTTREGVSYSYSAPICYEAILERQMWKMFQVDEGEPVDFFVNITNDAWYGVTAGPHQHAMLTAAQAVMFGRPLIRSAYTGISWIVEPHGRILYEAGLYERSTKVHPMRLGAVDTVFVRGGWIFPYLCILGTFIAVVMGRRRGSSSEESSEEDRATVTPPDSST